MKPLPLILTAVALALVLGLGTTLCFGVALANGLPEPEEMF